MINNPNFLWQPNIKYIYGYGCLEIVDKLDLEQFLAHISQNHRTFAPVQILLLGWSRKLFSGGASVIQQLSRISYLSIIKDREIYYFLYSRESDLTSMMSFSDENAIPLLFIHHHIISSTFPSTMSATFYVRIVIGRCHQFWNVVLPLVMCG